MCFFFHEIRRGVRFTITLLPPGTCLLFQFAIIELGRGRENQGKPGEQGEPARGTGGTWGNLGEPGGTMGNKEEQGKQGEQREQGKL